MLRLMTLQLLALTLLLGPSAGFAAAPTLGYASYFGGNNDEWVLASAVDAAGNLYLTGYTYSADLPGSSAEPRRSDIFVTKLDPTGRRVIYTTVFGGDDTEQGNAIAVDSAGAVWVVGESASDDFPAIDAIQATVPAPDYFNGVVARLDPSGKLVFSSYFGEEGAAHAVAVDAQGNAVIGGTLGQAILAKIDGQTNDLMFAINVADTSVQPLVSALALDAAGAIFITGQVKEAQLPTEGGLQPACAPFSRDECSYDAFLLRFAADGSAITYGTFLGGSADNGGSGSDTGTAIAVGADGSVYLVGETYASDFPTRNAVQATKTGPNNFSEAFVAKLTPTANGYALGYSTYLGGLGAEGARGIVVDATGNAYVAGYTGSLEFPVVEPLQPRLGNGVCELGGSERNCYDSFIAQLSADGELTFSSFFGGGLDDFATGIARRPDGAIAVVGHTEARDFPVSADALQAQKALQSDGFVFRLGAAGSGETPAFRIYLPMLTRK